MSEHNSIGSAIRLLKQLILETVEYHIKKHCMRVLSREIKKRDRYIQRANLQKMYVKTLWDKFNETYGGNQ